MYLSTFVLFYQDDKPLKASKQGTDYYYGDGYEENDINEEDNEDEYEEDSNGGFISGWYFDEK